jgi:hypothetical protein
MHTPNVLKSSLSKSNFKYFAAMAFAIILLCGCESKQNAAIDQAKKQAAATGQPQQVISVDKNGNTTTTTVQPPLPGQTAQSVTTTVTPGTGVPASAPAVAGGPAASSPQANSPQAGAPGPVPGGDPVVRPADVNVPAGTSLAIRINQHISVKTSSPGDRFDGELVEDLRGDNDRLILPKGTPVSGIVDESHRRGHFKGSSILELRLTSLTLDGTKYPLETRDYSRTKKGKGKRTAAFIGGGTGLGMLIGGIATGGTGLVIGGLAGAGAGTAAGAFTGNRDLEIPAESIVRFRLADDLTLVPSNT